MIMGSGFLGPISRHQADAAAGRLYFPRNYVMFRKHMAVRADLCGP
jgi:hypothetical protein